ncbi:RidA family protein [Paenibacillus radicis (ex Xue et al. 2023)]|uniref:Rid family hydrolase n=1 Tax=Paenibacillus radicis (ex Xue et al. 2023) TaxID=2972489 RepID=A0ABT1YDA5_9BACL|nr:RidA family protein [Paenibacillus radicis (ex Xue et al. 2023)]MCR8630389.1 Rid family hydrolase [Paenibacillus radicis (ex Xue et al. 2023)]
MKSTIEEIWPEGMPRPNIPYSPAVRAGKWLFVSAQSASDLTSGLAEEAKVHPSFPYYTDPIARQADYLYRRAEQIIEAAGARSEQVVRVNQWYVTDMKKPGYQTGDLTVNNKRYVERKNRYFETLSPPSTGIGISELLVEGTLVEADFTAIVAINGQLPELISAPDVPKPGPGFAEGVRLGNWVFLSGDLATDWKGNWGKAENEENIHSLALEARTNGLFWGDLPIRKQTEYVLTKLERIAYAAGTSLDMAVKAHVYLADPNDFTGFEDIWKTWFPDPYEAPSRTIVPNVELGAKGCRVEISLDLLIPEAKHLRKAIRGGWIPKSHESAAMRAEDLIYISGLMATAENGLAIEASLLPGLPYFGLSGKKQMEYILMKARRICDAAGVAIGQTVKANLYFSDLNLYAGAMEAWGEMFGGNHRPAVSVVEINRGLWVPGCGILVDFVIYDPKEAS